MSDSRAYPSREEEAEFYDRINTRKRQDARQRPASPKPPPSATRRADSPSVPNRPLVSTADASIRASLAKLAQRIEDSGIIEQQGSDPFWNNGELLLGLRNSEWLAIHRLNALLRELSK